MTLFRDGEREITPALTISFSRKRVTNDTPAVPYFNYRYKNDFDNFGGRRLKVGVMLGLTYASQASYAHQIIISSI
jgi:hypothetical protein